MEQIAKFNEKENRIILDDKYLFAFSKYDGFTERLLRAQLTINYDYEYNLELSAFQHERKTRNKSSFFTEIGTLSGQLLTYLESFLESDYLTLKEIYDYETFQILDIGSQQYLMNLEPKTTKIGIIDGLPVEYFKSDTEKILYKFNEYLKDWVEEKYRNWLDK